MAAGRNRTNPRLSLVWVTLYFSAYEFYNELTWKMWVCVCVLCMACGLSTRPFLEQKANIFRIYFAVRLLFIQFFFFLLLRPFSFFQRIDCMNMHIAEKCFSFEWENCIWKIDDVDRGYTTLLCSVVRSCIQFIIIIRSASVGDNIFRFYFLYKNVADPSRIERYTLHIWIRNHEWTPHICGRWQMPYSILCDLCVLCIWDD